jgi:ribonuclease P protein component
LTEPGCKFPKSKRLLRHSDFQRVYQNGGRQFTGNMTVFFLRRSSEGPLVPPAPRVGFTVGKVLGNSVERNRIRRRMREAVRQSWPAEGAPVDIVFNPRKSVAQMAFPELQAEVERCLKLALQRAREAGPQKRKAQGPGSQESSKKEQ